MMNVTRVTLEGHWARLVPLEREHAAALLEAGRDPAIWRYMPYSPTPSDGIEAMRLWIDEALRLEQDGTNLPFVILEVAGGRVAGSTRYLEILRRHHGLEIGGTWLGEPFRRTAINTECKYLLLRHAFETLGAIRVQLKTDLRNVTSQRAIERLGAVREGVLRQQMLMPDGYRRDTVMYSILDAEWPAVKAFLEGRIGLTRT